MGPYLGTWVPIGTFLTIWVPIFIKGPYFSRFRLMYASKVTRAKPAICTQCRLWEMGAELPRNSLSVAKEGKVFEQNKLLQPLLGTPEGTKMTGTSFFLQVLL